ncbi:Putative F-actin-capping protein subunit beta [Glycine soja]|uniref:F-actin-capping protein subunit beta n=1 Tax=Glycine soja TaxID=3848 RepID=A0A0B2QQV4_GLYSO|nr:Putative F-actin-capping protein subunit beta [Glycine soja]
MWEDDNEGFVACFLIKKDGSKTGQGRRGYLEEGAWDAIHVIEMSMKLSVADGHLCNMGRMIEEMESKLRNSLDQVLLDYTGFNCVLVVFEISFFTFCSLMGKGLGIYQI